MLQQATVAIRARLATVARAAAAMAARLAALAGWRRWLVALGLGTLSILAMAPFFASPVLLLTLPGLVWLIDGIVRSEPIPRRRLRAAAAVGWWFGFGYHAAGLFWIGKAFLVEAEVFAWLMPFAVTLMPAGLALFMAAAMAVSARFWRTDGGRVFVLALALTAAEWLRGHILTGFPWNVLGYALTEPLVLLQSVSVLGIYGLTLVVVIAAALPAVTLADHGATWSGTRGAAVTAALVAVLAIFGALRLAQPVPPPVDGVRVRIVQPSIPQDQKWQPANQRANFLKHLELTATAPNGRIDELAGVTHVIWPEAAMPFQPLRSPEVVAVLGERIGPGRWLLAGALRTVDGRDGRRRAFNSLMVFDSQGLSSLYDKTHLVPFGEYLPFQSLLESIGLEQLTRVRGGFSIGPEPRPLLSVPGLPPVGPLICYEAIFPAQVVQGPQRPGVLVNVTNDGWFGQTTGPRQHFHQARVRAVEEGVPLIRAANNGISGLVDPHGRILARIELDIAATADVAVPGALTLPIYARFGDIVCLSLWVSIFLTLMIGRPIKIL